MTIVERWRQNEGRVRQAGKLALERARVAGVPAYYRDPRIGDGIVRQMPDGSRSMVNGAANGVVTGDTARPRCTILAGSNGSGKSTIQELLQPDGQFINADVVARRLNPSHPEAASMEAGRLVLAALKDAIDRGDSFVYETTLSSRQSLNVMAHCRDAGYEVALVFVTLDDPDLNVLRVAERVSRGGHDIPEDVIRRRYDATLRRLPDALQLADDVLLFDNSNLEPRMLLSIEKGLIVHSSLDEAVPLYARLAEAIHQAGRLTGLQP